MRVRSRWQNKDKARSVNDTNSALAFIIWRIAANAVLNLENKGYQTDTNEQRLLTMLEFIGLLVHVMDRFAYTQLGQEQRQAMLTGLASCLAGHYQDNMTDAKGRGKHKKTFLEQLNQRMEDYAEFDFQDNNPDFGMRRLCGEYVTGRMGSKNAKWLTSQVMDVEVPEAMEVLIKALANLLPDWVNKTE